MARIFIVWSSTEGQTRRIVQTIEHEIKKAGHQLETINADEPPRGWIFSKADAVLVAASVHDGKYTDGIRRLLKQQSARLAGVPAAFASVSLSGADPAKQQEAEGYIAALLEETGWNPALTVSLGGALRYPEYSFYKRWTMKRIAQKGGFPTDTSKVHEFTDWDRVRTLAAEMVELATAGTLQHA